MTQYAVSHPTQRKAEQAEQRKLAEKQQRIEADLDGQAIDYVMNSRLGRRFLRRVFRISQCDSLEFTPNASLMANVIGRHQIGREIQGWLLDRCPTAFLQLLDEQKEDDTRAANSRNDQQRS